MFRFQPSVESLETRETPSSVGSIAPAGDSSYGTGIYTPADPAQTRLVAPEPSPEQAVTREYLVYSSFLSI